MRKNHAWGRLAVAALLVARCGPPPADPLVPVEPPVPPAVEVGPAETPPEPLQVPPPPACAPDPAAQRDVALEALLSVVGSAEGAEGWAARWALAQARPLPAGEVADLLDSDRPETRLGALRVLEDLGPHASDAVEEIIPLVHDEDEDVRQQAFRTLEAIGPGAAGAVPTLIGKLKKKKSRWYALSALARIGPAAAAALPRVRKLIETSKGEDREIAILALGGIGGDDAVDDLAAMLSLDDETRAAAIEALGLTRSEAALSIVLDIWLAHGEWDFIPAQNALVSLGRMAVPTLERVLDEGESWQQVDAAETLGLMERQKDTVVPILERATTHDLLAVRIKAVESLVLLGEPPDDALDVVIEALESGDVFNQKTALGTLRRLGTAASDAAPALAAVLAEENMMTIPDVLQALPAVAPAGKEAAPALVALLGQNMGSPYSVMFVLPAIAALGEGAAVAAPAIEPLLESENSQIRAMAFAAWVLVQPDPVEALPVIETTLVEGDGVERIAAVEVAATLGPAAAPLLPVLVERLEAGDDGVVLVLRRIGPGQDGVTQALLDALESPAPRVGAEAWCALRSFGDEAGADASEALDRWASDHPGFSCMGDTVTHARLHVWAAHLAGVEYHMLTSSGEVPLRDPFAGPPQSPDAVPSLVQTLGTGTTAERETAILTLGRLGPPAGEAVPALAGILEDPERTLVIEAILALGRILGGDELALYPVCGG